MAPSTPVAFWWLSTLALAAPFEMREPLLSLPGQRLSTVEVVIVGGLAWWMAALWRERRLPVERMGVLAWSSLIAAAALSSLVSPVSRANASHMTIRLALMAAVWAATVSATTAARRRQTLVACVFVSGVIVALLVLADFLDVRAVTAVLSRFRENVAVVGAQVRASGPFQYPTIASMFLEIAFALGLGLLASAPFGVQTAGLLLLLAVVAEAVIVTFTRSGLIVMVLSLLMVGWRDWRVRGDRRALAMFAGLGCLIVSGLLTSRSAEMLMLRLTTEGQGQWFSAVFDGPPRVRLDTRQQLAVPVRVTNTGRATWDSNAAEPVQLSYHWIDSESDAVVAWEGYRTAFPHPIAPGETTTVLAQVGSTGRPGEFRLMWDIEQEGRLWFSTEPGAMLTLIPGVVTGSPTGALGPLHGPRRIPRAAARPGRLVLWRGAMAMLTAHPWFGIGPDNYRLAYGRYTTLAAAADPRVHSNNMYFEVLTGTGIVGGAIALWLALRLARDAVTASVSSGLGPAIAGACAAIAVHGLADSFISFTGTYVLIAITLGLASGCARDSHAHRV